MLEKQRCEAVVALYSIVRPVLGDPDFVRWITPGEPDGRRVASPPGGVTDLLEPFSA